MGGEAERALRRWKRIAGAAVGAAVALLVLLAGTLIFFLRPARQMDDRLLGTWQSDADRTIATIRERRPVDEKQEAAFRRLFGHLRVTYGADTLTTDLGGVTEAGRYEVLGRDARSVVVREVDPKPSILPTSEFTVIYFDGPDAYYVYTQLGGIQEYFKRVR